MAVLTEKDKQEGKELIDMLESLPVEEKKQARIYIGALHDRQMILKEEPESEVEGDNENKNNFSHNKDGRC